MCNHAYHPLQRHDCREEKVFSPPALSRQGASAYRYGNSFLCIIADFSSLFNTVVIKIVDTTVNDVILYFHCLISIVYADSVMIWQYESRIVSAILLFVKYLIRSLGCRRAALAIQIAINDPDALCAVTKEIHCAVARAEECIWQAVEKNLRTVVLHAWKKNQGLLTLMTGYPLTAPPTVSEFIEIVAHYVEKTTEKTMLSEAENYEL